MRRRLARLGSLWSATRGRYVRAIFIFVTGTLGLEPDGRFGPTLRDQTRRGS